ncbi:MAG: hypothetical protein LC637_07140 [Xanthomonadaceae bacterium]|nr:hypothetical protein [Xanthomonadaceae bacterium]
MAVIALAIALVTAAGLVAGWEWVWRERGYSPQLSDDKDLWARFRQRASTLPPERTLTVIGASRIQLGWSSATFEQAMPGWQSVSLAINGHYPLAVLDDLAEDPRFAGTMLVSIDARGLSRALADMSQVYVRHFRRNFGPQRRLERALLDPLQQHLITADARFNLVRRAAGLVDGHRPYRPYTRLLPDRTIEADFSTPDLPALRAGFVGNLENYLNNNPPPDPDTWFSQLEPVFAAVQRIRQRGGEVVFVRMPTSGHYHRLFEKHYPRQRYWNRFSAAVDAPTIHFEDWPTLRSIDLPDDSHVDHSNRATITLALVKALQQKHVLPGTDQIK